MTRLMDIKGYWDMSSGDDFNDQNRWEGQILLHDDGFFEGIVIDPNSSYTEDRFVFGAYFPGRVLELFKFTPISVTSPFVFYGERDAKGYGGHFKSIGLFGSVPCGTSFITTQNVEMTRESVAEETKNLENRIQRYKENIMDDIGREFYDNTIATRKTLTQTILRNYEGRGFTLEEYEELRREFEPINERVMQKTDEAAKKLVKQKPILLTDEDDDLPF